MSAHGPGPAEAQSVPCEMTGDAAQSSVVELSLGALILAAMEQVFLDKSF